MLYTKSMEKNLKTVNKNITTTIDEEKKQKEIDYLEDQKIMENEDMLNSLELAFQADDEENNEFDAVLHEFGF